MQTMVRYVGLAVGALVMVVVLGGMGAIAQLMPNPAQPIALKKPAQSQEVPVEPVAPAPFLTLRELPSSRYTPRQEVAPADPSNYGQRFVTDIAGNPATNAPIVVIHETVGSASSAINTFQTPHPRDADQRSYHALIRRDGTVVYIVDPAYRAFGAGNSVFDGPNGIETVRTNPQFPPSVNNFAYHVSLETPPDGRGNGARHSGYTQAQYESLAWLIARTNVPESRITTHRAVDRSGSRRDPRSFDAQRLTTLLRTYSVG